MFLSFSYAGHRTSIFIMDLNIFSFLWLPEVFHWSKELHSVVCYIDLICNFIFPYFFTAGELFLLLIFHPNFFSVRQMFNCWATHMATFWCWFGKANNFFCSILKCLFNFFSCWGMSSRHLATSAGYCLRTLLLFVKSFLFHFPFFSGLSVDLSADGIFCRVHFCN